MKLVFFPANTTSVTQPMDQGVIKNFKTHYRKRILQSLVANIDSSSSVQELTKNITVLDALRWISDSYKNTCISKQCIKNAFKEAGFKVAADDFNNQTASSDEILDLLQSTGNASISEEEYIAIDNNVTTEEGFQSIDEIILAETQEDAVESDEEEQAEQNIVQNKIKNFGEAMLKITELDEFAVRINSPEMRQLILTMKSIIEKESVINKAKKQTTMFDFFQKK